MARPEALRWAWGCFSYLDSLVTYPLSLKNKKCLAPTAPTVSFAGNLSGLFLRFGSKTAVMKYPAADFSEKIFQELEPATKIGFQS